MKTQYIRFHSLCLVSLLALSLAVLPSHSRAGDKITVEEIVAKHLESIGSAETRASVRSRIASSSIVANLRSPGLARFEGAGIMASDGPKSMIRMGFEGPGKYEEGFGFDGKDVTVGYARPGNRGYWGDFLMTHPNIIKEGLVGGTLSEAWPLLNLADRKIKLQYKGLKKIDGRNVHEVKYFPHGSTDVEISLFFDSETFQHVRTEYTRVISAGLGTGVIGTGRVSTPSQSGAIDASGGQRPTRYKMYEEFSEFSKESGLTLPHSYKIGLELDTKGGTLLADWNFKITQFSFNEAIPPATFVIK